MEVMVLQIRIVGKGFRIAHVQAGDLYGDVPASEGIQVGQIGKLRQTLKVMDGRLQSSLRVEPLTK